MEHRSSETFGALLKRYRSACGWTQAELAQQSGVSAVSICNVERGAPRRPRYQTLELLAGALDLPLQERADFIARGRGHHPTMVGPVSDPSVSSRSASARYLGSVPLPPTALIGREKELAGILTCLARPQVRLLSVIGPAGCGKTHLSLVVAQQAAARFRDGVHFVSLAPLRDPGLLVSAIAQALGLQEHEQEPLIETLVQYLAAEHLLLLLDNVEHLAIAAPQIAALLQSCPQLYVLVTSRVALHLRGEHEQLLLPLALPDLRALPPLSDLAKVPAVNLLLERASAAVPTFRLTETNAATVAAICCQLDGLPLALELAAPLVNVLSPEMLLERLAHRLDLLVDGPADLPERQRSLRATLTWSYDLLDPPEQVLFRRLSIFAGGATLEAIEAIASVPEVPVNTAMQVLARLCAASLIQRSETPEGSVRFTELETMREYGWEGLVAQGEAVSTQQQHAAYYLALAEDACPRMFGSEQAECLSRLEEEHHNLRAALRWLLDQREVVLAMRLAVALEPFWERRGWLREGRGWLERILALAEGQEASLPSSLYAKALNGASSLAFDHGDYVPARAWRERSLALYERMQDQDGIATVYLTLGVEAHFHGDLARARELHQQSLVIWRARGDLRHEAISLNALGIVARLQGDFATARELYEASLTIRQETGDEGGIATMLCNLGSVAVDEGDYDHAVRLFRQALAIQHRVLERQQVGHVLAHLADVARLRGEYAEAERLADEAVALFESVEDNAGLGIGLISRATIACAQEDVARAGKLCRRGLQLCIKIKARVDVADFLERLAHVACKRACPEVAAERLGAAAALRETIGIPRPPRDNTWYTTVIQGILHQLGSDRFAASWVVGRERSLEEMIAEALTAEGHEDASLVNL